MSGLLVRVGESERRQVRLTINGAPVQALEGDTLLTAVLLHGDRLRFSEFGDGPRAGLCLMGACQDCWVRLSDGSSVRACTTFVRESMSVSTVPIGES